VGVSFSGVGGVHPGFYKNVTSALYIFGWDVFGLHHGESQLIFLNRFRRNIPLFLSLSTSVILLVFDIINVDPAENCALR